MSDLYFAVSVAIFGAFILSGTMLAILVLSWP